MKLKKIGLLISGIAALLFLLFTIMFGIGEVVSVGMTDDLDALDAGQRWSATGESYATIALYTDMENALSRNRVESYAMAVDAALLNASITSAENGKVWTYGYYAEALLPASGPKSTANLQTMAVGGSFFTFHPLEFVYGAPLMWDRSLPDGVVLDEDAAWRLFGALDVVGMSIEVGGRELTVTGIVRRERDTEAYKTAYGDIPRMYMSYYGYEAIYGENSNITTLEMTLPNPVKGFGMNIFQTAVQVQKDGMVVRENDSRYTMIHRLERMKNLPFMGMRNDRVIYPYFENELQVLDFYTSLWMVFQTVVGAAAILCLLTAVISLFAAGFSITGLFRTGVQYWQNKGKMQTGKRRRKRKRKIS